MEKNTTNQQYSNGALPLTEPHFAEEATLLSARRVVPLQDVKADERSRRRLFIGLAMACSIVVGALGATLIYKQQGQQSSGAIGSNAVPGAAAAALDKSGSVMAEEVGGAVTGTLPQAGAVTVDKRSVSRSATATVETKRRKPSPQQLDEGELSRPERIDARRLKRRFDREASREAGGRQRRPADDLLRIREIFEGPSRP